MGVPLAHVGAVVQCAHGGSAQPTVPNPRVRVGGMPTVAISSPYAVAGCSMPPPPAGNGPCATGQFLMGTTRVRSNGQPLVLQSSPSTCAPTGTPLVVVNTQPRVKAL